jgi:hypothetical protein
MVQAGFIRPSQIPVTPIQRILTGPTATNILSYPAQKVTGRYEEESIINQNQIEQIIRGANGNIRKPKNIMRSVIEPSSRLPPLQPIKLSKRPTPNNKQMFF